MNDTKYDFDFWRTNMVLEALQTLEEKWTALMEAAAAKNDEDTCADYGNDMARLSILREGFERFAVEAFGPQVKNFSREPIPATPPKASGF